MTEVANSSGEALVRPNTVIALDEEHYLRLSNGEDIDQLYKTMQDNQEHLSPHLGKTDSESLQDLQRVSQERARQIAKGEWLQYRIVEGAGEISDDILGMVTVFEIDHHNRTGHLGYWVAKQAEGKGLAFRSAQQIMEEARRVHGLKQFILKIAADNSRSEALALRLGGQRTDRTSLEDLDGVPQTYRIWEINHG